MSTETPKIATLSAALQERLGEHGAQLAIDVFAAWADSAAADAKETAAKGCFPGCRDDHAANVSHFQHVALVLRNAYEARPLTAEDQTPIVAARPDLTDGLEMEGGAFGDDDEPGWQVVHYSSARSWPCMPEEADSVLIRAGHISFAEARRMGAALIALADQGEAKTAGGAA